MDASTIACYDREAVGISARHRSRDPELWRRRFLAAFPQGGRILDVGCGSGRDLALLLELGFEALGTEPSAGMRVAAMKAYPRLAGRILDFGLPLPKPADFGGAFDGIVCSAVLMHVPAPELSAALTSLRRALRPGGRLWVTIPGPRPGLDAEGRDDGGRLFRDVPNAMLLDLCAAAGLRRVDDWEEPDRLGRAAIRWHGHIFAAEEPG